MLSYYKFYVLTIPDSSDNMSINNLCNKNNTARQSLPNKYFDNFHYYHVIDFFFKKMEPYLKES